MFLVGKRSSKCVDVINDLMGYALGSVYVQNVFDDESVEEVFFLI
jgi:predicted metalloendopeptidase